MFLFQQNLLIFECDPDSEEWKSYVCYLESIIEHGLIDSIKCSLEYLAENTDAENKKLVRKLSYKSYINNFNHY